MPWNRRLQCRSCRDDQKAGEDRLCGLVPDHTSGRSCLPACLACLLAWLPARLAPCLPAPARACACSGCPSRPVSGAERSEQWAPWDRSVQGTWVEHGCPGTADCSAGAEHSEQWAPWDRSVQCTWVEHWMPWGSCEWDFTKCKMDLETPKEPKSDALEPKSDALDYHKVGATPGM